MEQHNSAYIKLQKHLDKQAVGFPATRSGTELNVLKHIFTPQEAEFICSCCGCCCGMLSVHKRLPKPLDFWASNYFATVSRGTCVGCGVCARRCQVGAVKLSGKDFVKDLDSY